MNPSQRSPQNTSPRRPTRTAVLALALAAGSGHAAIVNWTGAAADDQWSTGINWSTGVNPAFNDVVKIGLLANVERETIDLDMNELVASLELWDSMRIDTKSHHMVVSDTARFNGHESLNGFAYASGLTVRPAAGTSFKARQIISENGARIRLYDGSIEAEDSFSSGPNCSIYGTGLISLTSPGATFNNDGIIQVATDTALEILLTNGGAVDLDGVTGDGYVHAATYDPAQEVGTYFHLRADGLYDPYSAWLPIGTNSTVYMELQQPWVLDQSSDLSFFDLSDDAPLAGRLLGAGVEINGLVKTFGYAIGVIGTDSIAIEPDAQIEVGTDSEMYMGLNNGFISTEVDVNGGLFTFWPGSTLYFHGDTTVAAGQFDMGDETGNQGRVEFNGSTNYVGGFTSNGYFQQNGDARIGHTTLIEAGRFDLDGADGNTTWDIDGIATMNIGSTSAYLFPSFSGTMNISSGIVNNITLNFDAPFYTFFGDLNLSGYSLGHVSRLRGTPVRFAGNVTLPSYKAAIAADFTINHDATVNLTAATADLRANANATVAEGATFTGAGVFSVGGAGHLDVGDGVDLATVGLANHGLFEIGSPALPALATGIASADRFVQTSGGEWLVTIGGHAPGADYDRLIASGAGSSAAGSVSARFMSTAGGAFVPEIGDTFEFFTAPAGYTGAFNASSPTTVPVNSGIIREAKVTWTIDHFADSAQIRVTDVVLYCYADVTTTHANPADPGYGVPDSVVDGSDLAFFVEHWLAGSFKVADINTKNINPGDPGWGEPDGLVDGADLSFYVERWLAGCG